MTSAPRVGRGLLLALVVLFVGSLAIALGAPARGLEQEGTTVGKDKPANKTYGPIPGQNPALVANPDGCATAPWCAVVPLTIEHPPGFSPEGDDFTVAIEVSWPDVDVEGSHGNDVDVYVYALPFDPDAEPSQEPIGQSASASNPEKVNLFRPPTEKVAIVVNNFTGVNQGFTVTASYIDFPIPPVFESLEPPTQSQPQGGNLENIGDNAPTGIDLGLGFDGGGGVSPIESGAPLASALGDAAYAFEPPPAADQLPALGDQRLPGTRRSSAEPVSSTTVLLWLVGSAIVISAAAAGWLLRKRPAALRYA